MIFDRNLRELRKDRISDRFEHHNFLHTEVADRILDNLLGLNFNSILEIGAMDGYLARQLALTFKPEFLVTTETLLKLAPTVVCDDELLPFKANSFDLIVSNLNFQQLNLIPQFLTQVLSILKPKGIFMATFFGEESLLALKEIVYQVELDLYGSASPRFAPVIDLKTAANLLAKTGFSDPIATCEKIMVSYADPLKLLRDLKMMGQSNILTKRSRQFFSKKFLAEIIKRYQKIPETIFEIITITAKKS